MNNLFLQDTVTVVTHKKRRYLKEISTNEKICSTSSNKDFLLDLFRMDLFGAAYGWGDQKGPSSPKSVRHILQ